MGRGYNGKGRGMGQGMVEEKNGHVGDHGKGRRDGAGDNGEDYVIGRRDCEERKNWAGLHRKGGEIMLMIIRRKDRWSRGSWEWNRDGTEINERMKPWLQRIMGGEMACRIMGREEGS